MSTTSSTSATLSSQGLGSGIDIGTMVSSLVNASSGTLTNLQNQQASVQAEISAYGQLSSALSAFQASMKTAATTSTYQGYTATTGSSGVLGATAGSSAAAGSHSVTVNYLAQAQVLESGGYAASNSTVGYGTLTIAFGSYTAGGSFSANPDQGALTVTITPGENTLSGIRDAINAANGPVTASIVNDGSGGGTAYHLLLTSKNTGASYGMQITATPDPSDTTGNLSALNYSPSLDPAQNPGAAGQAMGQTVAAKDASLSIDNIPISSASNSITDALQGVTLNLQTPGTTTVNVSQNTGAITSAVQNFVNAYNTLNSALSNLTAYNAATKTAGPLLGDATTMAVQSQLRNLLNTQLPATTGGYTDLSQIGISYNADGSMALNTGTLNTAIASNVNGVASLFATAASSNNSAVTYGGASSDTQPGTYAVQVTAPATHGSLTGAGAAFSAVTSANNQLTVTLDGRADTVTLPTGFLSGGPSAAAATQLQTLINGVSDFSSNGIGVTVTYDSSQNAFVMTSNSYGSASGVNVSGNGAANLFGTATNGVSGQDVAGTINGAAATGHGQTLTLNSAGNPASGLILNVTAAAAGSYGSVSVTQGFASQLGNFLQNYTDPSTGILQQVTGNLNKTVTRLTSQETDEQARLTQLQTTLTAEFNAMDSLVGSLKTTGTYLANMLSTLSNNTLSAQSKSSG